VSTEELLKKYGIQIHDLEYILNFMQKENITPQLAMRRIKLFEKLQEKMSKTQTIEQSQKIKELDHLSKLVEELQAEKKKLTEEKERLLKEIEDAKLQQDLFQAEREELKMQMMALMDSIKTMEEGETREEEELKNEVKELKRKLSLITAGIERLKEELNILPQNSSYSRVINEIKKVLELITEGRELPRGGLLKIPVTVKETVKIEEEPKKETVHEESIVETISPDEIKFVKPSTITTKNTMVKRETIPRPAQKTKTITAKPTLKTQKIKSEVAIKEEVKKPEVTEKKTRPVIKEKIFVEPTEITKEVPIEAKTSVAKEVPAEAIEKPAHTITIEKERGEEKKEEVKKKINISAKPIKEKKEVPEKIEKILKLFINYVNQADSDENFKARIAAICDMEEAYIELGGLAMAQIYSYQTQGIKKKKEFERLLNSWIENGLPR